MLFLLAVSIFVPAESGSSSVAVKLRAAKHQDSIRIVLAADEAIVKSASVILTKNKAVIVDLHPAAEAGAERPTIAFETDKGALTGDVPVEIMNSVTVVAKGTGCIITIPKVEDIKVLKLQSPSRLVIDAFFGPAPRESAAVPQSLKPPAEQIPFRYIFVDAGHGGYDYGIRGKNYSEKDFALQFSRDFAAAFGKGGREAQLTRKSDQIMTLTERIAAINRKVPELLLSFHLASTKIPIIYVVPERPEAGMELPVASNGDQKKREMINSITAAIAAGIEKEFSVRPLKETLPLTLLVKSKAPAILVELPNPDEFSYEKKNRERLISTILKALATGAKEEKPVLPPTTQKPEPRPIEKSADRTEKM
ncbi:MAG TPA: N-acetylmuramoyl-L-alanine amidase [Dissulfurispiraceae bacterium]|nr:N-acetylmuramoyl-L-alanine amidase [Dissulfurispiraceae bacterium]